MIEIKQLTKKFDNNKIFDNLNLAIETGKAIAIIGKSGSGKSTLLNILGLLDTDYKGVVLINDIEINKLNEKERTIFIRENVNYLFQNFALIENRTVEYNLLLALEHESIVKNKKIEIINNVLAKINMQGFNSKKIHTLSGGEQQRIALARTIIKKGDIILADEPTGNLDQENAKVIMEILLGQVQNGKTVLIVTHDNNIANKCDLVINLK